MMASSSAKPSKRIRLSKDDYRVAWICALPVPEWKASRHMFDEIHEDLDLGNSAQHQYVYGAINGHTVVMGCLPASQIGQESSAAVMAEMTSLFPYLRFALLVGVAGGVWTPDQDLRLGDVVVGQPSRDPPHGGVTQYDFGKALPGRPLKLMGHLKMPSRLLLSALGKIQSAPPGDSQFENYLAAFDSYRDQNTKQPIFQRPKTEDVLFKSAEGEDDQPVPRPSREHAQPIIHYGHIATGSQVIKDAAKRDEIVALLGGVLAFEMEAAGVINQQLSCLVIRGICDYCDVQKNEAWQAYAAATAAAWSKEILRNIHVAPSEARTLALRETDPSASARYEEWIANLATQLTRKRATVDRKAEAQQLIRRISTYDARNALECLLARTFKGTNTWISRDPTFLGWLRQPEPNMLLITGKIGSGKSFAMAYAVQCLLTIKRSRCAILHHFAQHNGESPLDVFRSYAKQLIQSFEYANIECPAEIADRLTRGFGTANRLIDIEVIIQFVLSPLIKRHGKVIICFDGIEAFDQEDQRQLLQGIMKLEVKSLISARDRFRLRGLSSSKVELITLDSGNNQIDIEKYIDANLAPLSVEDSVLHDSSLRENIKQELISKADGMFLWVCLQIELMRDASSVDDIRFSMSQIPTRIEELFRHCLLRRAQGKSAFEPKLLQYVVAVQEPFTLNQLYELLDLADPDQAHARDEPSVLRAGADLIVIQLDQTVVPVHHSVKQFLFTKLQHDFRASTRFSDRVYQQLARSEQDTILDVASISLQLILDRCRGALSKDIRFQVPAPSNFLPASLRKILPSRSEATLKFTSLSTHRKARHNNFLTYAIRSWIVLTRGIDETQQPWSLFKDVALTHELTQRVHPWTTQDSRSTMTESTHLKGLMGYAVAHNHLPLLKLVLEYQSPSANKLFKRALYGNDLLPPLHVAAAGGFSDTILALIPFCDINQRAGEEKATPLWFAFDAGHYSVARLLFEKGADCRVVLEQYRTVLDHAHKSSDSRYVDRLLTSADQTLMWDALEQAARDGKITIVKLLREYGATNLDEGLRNAAASGITEVVKLLLKHGARDYDAAVVAAAEHGHVQVVKLLLRFEDLDYGIAMFAAAENGHTEVVKLLLESGVPPYRTAMPVAAMFGHFETVKLLFDAGATEYGNTLIKAVGRSALDIVKLLLESGVTFLDYDLHIAINRAISPEIKKLLQDHRSAAQTRSFSATSSIPPQRT